MEYLDLLGMPEGPERDRILAHHLAGVVTHLPASAVAQAREEGRQEILQEIAKLDPYGASMPYDGCVGCGNRDYEAHLPACLWRRAQESGT